MNKVDGFFRLLSDKKFTGYSSDFWNIILCFHFVGLNMKNNFHGADCGSHLL
jgi:hypothetical protein